MPPAPALVTTALPYANGPLHLGHLVGYIQADIWVRARRMAGGQAHFVCADDAHGTPIMLAAEKAGQSPEDFIRGIQASHEADFAAFGVAFDHYHSTHSDENRQLAELIYTRLRDGSYAQSAGEKYIASRSIEQLYDPVKDMFLPDRYIKGECPNCGSPDQYGDNCEVCGKAYSPTDLKNPRSVVSGATPVLRESVHYFFELGKFQAFLRQWMSGALTGGHAIAHSSVVAKLNEWLEGDGGLRDWDISRDAPYFGFAIPDAPGKFFYVWLDAPIGYLASFKAYCEKTGLDFAQFTDATRNAAIETEMHHFIGKDIINFHGLFWPAMLHGSGFRAPTKLHVNGYLKVNGDKMSKSRGTFIMARTFLDAGLNAETLRYYFAAKSGIGMDDLDLNFDDYTARVNSDLVGKFVNIASRCARIAEQQAGSYIDGRGLEEKLSKAEVTIKLAGVDWNSPTYPGEIEADAIFSLATVSAIVGQTEALYEKGELISVAKSLMRAADIANEFIARTAPWALAKDSERSRELSLVLWSALNMFRDIAIGISPILPDISREASAFLNDETMLDSFKRIGKYLSDHQLRQYKPLLTRIDPKHIETMIEASKDTLQAADAPADATKPAKAVTHAAKPAPAPADGPIAAHAAPTGTSPAAAAAISIDDFAKLDLRVGTVLECAFVDGSDKLLRFKLDAGVLGERQIFSGIRAGYPEPEKLVGRQVVFIANLAPRKMRFGVSEGMILSAGGDDSLFLLDVDAGALAGMTVK